jgi:hypothetical protein
MDDESTPDILILSPCANLHKAQIFDYTKIIYLFTKILITVLGFSKEFFNLRFIGSVGFGDHLADSLLATTLFA